MTTLIPLPELIARRRVASDAVHFEVGDDWAQGRTCYGGLISTLGVVAMRDIAAAAFGDAASLRGLQTCFVGPVSPGAVEIGVQLLRQGRNVCQVLAQARQDGQVAAVLIGVFGAERASSLQPLLPQRAAPRREAADLPAPPRGIGPTFLAHFDTRWAEGSPPFSGGEGHRSSIHMRLADGAAAALATELLIVLLADLPPTPAVGQLRQPGANSSVTWALEPRPVDKGASDGWWRADNESTMVAGGYVNHRSTLWAPGGELAAYGSQVVAVFG